MAQRFSPNTSVAEQILLNPTFANIDFADFQGLDMNLIDRNAEYTQNIANKRFEGMLDAQAKLLEEIKLHKKFDYLEKDLQNKLASVIDNAGNVQLSDNANFNKLNTSLISLKADPQLRKAVYSSEEARKAKEIFDKDPDLRNRPWDAPGLVRNYDAFLNNETNDFELTPIYKGVNYVGVWDEFFKELPEEEQIALEKYGPYGLVQAKEQGRDIGKLLEKIKDYENFTIKNNTEIKANLNRRKDYYKTQGLTEELAETENEKLLKDSLKASASKFAQVNRSITNPEMDPNASGRFQARQLAISEINARTAENQLTVGEPVTRNGLILYRGGKPVDQDLQKLYNSDVKTAAIKKISIKKGFTIDTKGIQLGSAPNGSAIVTIPTYSEIGTEKIEKIPLSDEELNNILNTTAPPSTKIKFN